MTRFRDLKKCKFWQVKNGTFFWSGSEPVRGMQDLARYCKDDVRVIRIDPSYHDPDEYCPAGIADGNVYPFNPTDIVYTFADRITHKSDEAHV